MTARLSSLTTASRRSFTRGVSRDEMNQRLKAQTDDASAAHFHKDHTMRMKMTVDEAWFRVCSVCDTDDVDGVLDFWREKRAETAQLEKSVERRLDLIETHKRKKSEHEENCERAPADRTRNGRAGWR